MRLGLYASCVGRDECILSYLTELTVEENADVKSGYRIALAFDVNPLFHNSVIEKRLSWHEGGELTMQTTPMSWKPGQVCTPCTHASWLWLSTPSSRQDHPRRTRWH